MTLATLMTDWPDQHIEDVPGLKGLLSTNLLNFSLKLAVVLMAIALGAWLLGGLDAWAAAPMPQAGQNMLHSWAAAYHQFCAGLFEPAAGGAYDGAGAMAPPI